MVGFNKPSYESSMNSAFKNPDLDSINKLNNRGALQQNKHLQRSHFMLGNEPVGGFQARKNTLNKSTDLVKMVKQNKDFNQDRKAIKKHARNQHKSIFTLMKQQNIVYGYEKQNPF